MAIEAPLITGALAGSLLVLQQFLMMTVGMRRITTQVGVGFEHDTTLERLIRRHGNLAENAAIFLVVLSLLEILGASATLVAVLAGVFLAARILHALGFSSLAGSHGGNFAAGGRKVFVMLRSAGAMTTAFTGFAAGGYLVFFAATRLFST